MEQSAGFDPTEHSFSPENQQKVIDEAINEEMAKSHGIGDFLKRKHRNSKFGKYNNANKTIDQSDKMTF